MNSVYEQPTIQGLKDRIAQLRPDTQRLWGKMDVAQMMSHCATAMEGAVGEDKGKQGFFGMIFGGIAKKSLVNAAPFKQNLPTAREFVVLGTKNFEQEKKRLLTILDKLLSKGAAAAEGKIHPLFGEMNAQEWSTLIYKHLDHHLKQFGV